MGCPWLTIIGGGMEMIGFDLIVFQLARVQRQEFGTPVFITRGEAPAGLPRTGRSVPLQDFGYLFN